MQILSIFQTVTWSELAHVIGLFGAGLYILAFFLLQTERIAPCGACYRALNLAAPTAVLLSLTTAFNAASLIIQVTWLLIGFYSITRSFANRRGPNRTRETRHVREFQRVEPSFRGTGHQD